MKKKNEKWEVQHERKTYVIGHSDVKEIIRSNYIMTKALYFVGILLTVILILGTLTFVEYYKVFKFLNNEQFLTGLINLIYGG